MGLGNREGGGGWGRGCEVVWGRDAGEEGLGNGEVLLRGVKGRIGGGCDVLVMCP